MAGSLDQANIVYNYFQDYCDISDSVVGTIVGGARGIKLGTTEAVAGHRFMCVAASPKSVRGKHEQVLLMDEVCEIIDSLVDSALPIVSNSHGARVVMASTFHKVFGRFADTWDNAEERKYLRISWDIFDVAEQFDASIWDIEEIANIHDIAKLKLMAKGRTGDPQGWIPFANIIQAWREKPTLDWFEVEYMGSRPSAAGLVLKPEDVDSSVFDSDIDRAYTYVQGATVAVGIDWGFSSMTAVVGLMGHRDQVVSMIHNKNYSQVPSEDIIKDVIIFVKEHRVRFIYADSAGKFENVALQNELIKQKIACTVIEVVFSKEKFGTPGIDGAIGMLGNLRAHFEQKKFKLPKKYRDAFYQLKNYRYQEGTDKPVKNNDHIPDATMCGLQHFMLGKFTRPLSPQKDPPKGSDKPITAGILKKVF